MMIGPKMWIGSWTLSEDRQMLARRCELVNDGKGLVIRFREVGSRTNASLA